MRISSIRMFAMRCRAITGHKTLQMPEYYGRGTRLNVLARSAIKLLEHHTNEQDGNLLNPGDRTIKPFPCLPLKSLF